MSSLSLKRTVRLRGPLHHPLAEPTMVLVMPGWLHIPPQVPGTRDAVPTQLLLTLMGDGQQAARASARGLAALGMAGHTPGATIHLSP